MLQFFGMAHYNPTKVAMTKSTKLVVDKVDPATYNKMVNKLIYLVNIRQYVHFKKKIIISPFLIDPNYFTPVQLNKYLDI
jgi:hypothetical protein